tara:strand:+ start:55 stop:753 length:699 start_codon:yes stop_codon:yes gene_type:complete
MKRNNIEKIKSLESAPKILNIFSEQEIKMMQDLYEDLPLRVFNKKQNVKKKMWIQNYNLDLEKIYLEKLKIHMGDFKMDNLKDENGKDFFAIIHESFSPLKLHVDSGFYKDDLIYKQVVTPLSNFGETVVFKNRWYGRSTTFTIDEEELKFIPGEGQNSRSNEHIVKGKDFDKEVYNKYLTHIDYNNLRGLEVELIYKWKVGETVIMDRTHIHCSSSNIKDKKLGLTTFTKK